MPENVIFQVNPKAIEVLVYKGKKAIVVTRRIAENPLFLIQFQRKFVKLKSRLIGVAFKNGAGSIRAYPHAENTGLVISDTAKIGSFSITSKLLALFFQITIYFLP